jgi:hypothetical protein
VPATRTVALSALVAVVSSMSQADLRHVSAAARVSRDVGGVFVPGDRLVLIHTGGDPALDFVNGIGLEAVLRFGR